MKKTVFDLSSEEGKKIDKELRCTSYYKQYLVGYIATILFIFFMYIVVTSLHEFINPIISEDTFSLICIMILSGFVALISLLFWFKRFDLVKKYYGEKYSKEKE